MFPEPALLRFRSPLPAESRLISVSRPTEMFHFGRCWPDLSLDFRFWGSVLPANIADKTARHPQAQGYTWVGGPAGPVQPPGS